MKRITIVLSCLMICCVLIAQQPLMTLGFTAVIAAQTGSVSVGGTNFLDIMYYELTPHTVTHMQAYVTAITGSPLTGDQTMEQQIDSGGSPNNSGACTLTNTVAVAANTWIDFAGSCGMGADSQFHWVVKNATASTTVSYRIWNNAQPMFLGAMKNGYGYQTTTNSGTTWTVGAYGNQPAFIMIRSDATYRGFPYDTLLTTAQMSTSEKLFGASKYVGFEFTTPTNVKINLWGIGCPVSRIASPTGNLTGVLYSDNGTDINVFAAGAHTFVYTDFNTTANAMPTIFRFSSVPTLNAGTQYVFAMNDNAADSSTVYYFTSLITAPNTTAANALQILGWHEMLCSSGSSCFGSGGTRANWSTGNNMPTCVIIPDPSNPFTSTGTGGGASGYSYSSIGN